MRQIDRRISKLERHTDGSSEIVFVIEGQPIPAGANPLFVVTETAGGDLRFPPGFVWPGLEQDLDAIDAGKEKS